MIDITKETGIAAAIGLVLGGLAVYGLKRGCSKGMLAGLDGEFVEETGGIVRVGAKSWYECPKDRDYAWSWMNNRCSRRLTKGDVVVLDRPGDIDLHVGGGSHQRVRTMSLPTGTKITCTRTGDEYTNSKFRIETP